MIIDAGGRDSVELRGALVVAEQVFVPLQASQFDVWTLDRMDELVAQAQGINEGLRAFVVINRASPNPVVSEAQEAREFLTEFAHLGLVETLIRDRIAYRKAAREGLTVIELPQHDPKAAVEIQQLYTEVFGDEWIEADTA